MSDNHASNHASGPESTSAVGTLKPSKPAGTGSLRPKTLFQSHSFGAGGSSRGNLHSLDSPSLSTSFQANFYRRTISSDLGTTSSGSNVQPSSHRGSGDAFTGRQSISLRSSDVNALVANIQQSDKKPLPSSSYDGDEELRLIEMCANHRMFQFLFDSDGYLVIANKRAMASIQNHLGRGGSSGAAVSILNEAIMSL